MSYVSPLFTVKTITTIQTSTQNSRRSAFKTSNVVLTCFSQIPPSFYYGKILPPYIYYLQAAGARLSGFNNQINLRYYIIFRLICLLNINCTHLILVVGHFATCCANPNLGLHSVQDNVYGHNAKILSAKRSLKLKNEHYFLFYMHCDIILVNDH